MLLEGMMIAAIPVGVLLALILWIKFEIQKHGTTKHDHVNICSVRLWRDRIMVLDEQRLVVDRVREQRARKTHPADRLFKDILGRQVTLLSDRRNEPGFLSYSRVYFYSQVIHNLLCITFFKHFCKKIRIALIYSLSLIK